MSEKPLIVMIVDDDASFRAFLERLVGTVGPSPRPRSFSAPQPGHAEDMCRVGGRPGADGRQIRRRAAGAPGCIVL